MLLFTSLLAILSIILLLIGLFKPSWVLWWAEKSKQTRKRVFLYWFWLFFLCISLYSGFLINWVFVILLDSMIIGVLAFVILIFGILFPLKVYVIGSNTRLKVFLQYSMLIGIALTTLIVGGLGLENVDTMDERVVLSVYDGESIGGVKNGFGILSNNSSYYEGYWHAGDRDSYGIEFSDYGWMSTYYEGEWANNVEHGKGKMVTKILWMETVYEGDWLNGYREGFGRFIDNDGQVYEGLWEKNEGKEE